MNLADRALTVIGERVRILAAHPEWPGRNRDHAP